MKRNIDAGLLTLRLTLGILMLLHGIAKLPKGPGGIMKKLSGHGLPEFIAYGVYLGEIAAPLLLIAGFRSRIAALVYAFTMLVAVMLSHSEDALSLGKSGGWAVELNALYFFGALVLVFTGAGKYAVSTGNKWD